MSDTEYDTTQSNAETPAPDDAAQGETTEDTTTAAEQTVPAGDDDDQGAAAAEARELGDEHTQADNSAL